MTNKTVSLTKAVIPCRLSYANIWEPRSINGGETKYSVSCIIPKNDKATLQKIQSAIEKAVEEARGKKWGGKVPPDLKLPVHDGDNERPDDENYAGCIYLNASSKDAPQIVDRKVRPIRDPMECRSGDYANVSVNFYGYDAEGRRGIAAGLGNIQKVCDGERLTGRADAANDFEALEEVDVDGESVFGERVFGGEVPEYLK